MLIKIYSETNLIDTVPFHNGINIILGKYFGDKEARGINGIGKSTLVRLVDFTLLSGKAEKRFAPYCFHILIQYGQNHYFFC